MSEGGRVYRAQEAAYAEEGFTGIHAEVQGRYPPAQGEDLA